MKKMHLLKNKLKRLWWLFTRLFHRYSKEDRETIKQNKKLVKKFPFLLPKHRLYGVMHYQYDYLYTELDSMPKAWREVFGIEMCEKIKACLDKANYAKKYFITDIKEKYGTLRWYDSGVPNSISKEFNEIIRYYEHKSQLVCIYCGKTAKYETGGWISFICEDCFKKQITECPNMNYYELTWSDIPVTVTYLPTGESYTTDSPLKGDMMVAWKRYSKHNNLVLKKDKEPEQKEYEAVTVADLWNKEGEK